MVLGIEILAEDTNEETGVDMLSQKKMQKLELEGRRREVNRRSLNGKGLFMEANWDSAAAAYVRTGDKQYLERLPQPRG